MPASSQRQGPALAAAAIMATLASACPAFAQDRTENSFDFRLEVPAPHVTDAPAVIANPEWDAIPAPDARPEGQADSDRLVFNCGFLPDGQLSDCGTITRSYPSSDTVQAIVGRGRLSARTVAAASPDARVVFEVAVPTRPNIPPVILPPDPRIVLPVKKDTTSGKLAVISAPKWTRPITAEFPPVAASRGMSRGDVTLNCGFLPDGGLADCRIASEGPEGGGFEDAALAAAREGRLTSETVETANSDARVLFTIRFVNPNARPSVALEDSATIATSPSITFHLPSPASPRYP